MSTLVTHHTGRGLGKMEDLILQVLEAASQQPAGVLAANEAHASEIANRVRKQAPDFDAEVAGTCVTVRRRKR